MKKLIFGILICMMLGFVFSSCNNNETNPTKNLVGVEVLDSSIIIEEDFCGDVKYHLITIDDHEYLYRTWTTGGGGYGSDLVHSASCKKCFEMFRLIL